MNFAKILVGLVASALVGSSVAIAAPASAKHDAALLDQSGKSQLGYEKKSVKKTQSVLKLLK